MEDNLLQDPTMQFKDSQELEVSSETNCQSQGL